MPTRFIYFIERTFHLFHSISHLEFRVSAVYNIFVSYMQLQNQMNESAIANDRAVRPTVIHQAENIQLSPHVSDETINCKPKSVNETTNIARIQFERKPDDLERIENRQIETVQMQKEHQNSPNKSMDGLVANDRKRRKVTISGNPNKKQKLTNNSDKHINTLTNGKHTHECKVCTKSFVRSQTLDKHMKIHEHKKISFQCSNCYHEFSREKAWKSHEYGCTRGLRQYECHLCKKIVHHKNHLLQHAYW